MKKVIFIYGFKGYKNQSRVAKKILNKYEVICFEYNSNLKQSIKEITLELKDFIDKETIKKEKVNLIGVSAGGIIASYYAKFVSPEKVDKLATICSPFRGTYVSKFYSKKLKGVRELKKNSYLLKKITAKKLNKNKTINFWCCIDLLVPGNSGKGENPVHTWNFFHFTIHNNKRIFKKIKEFFDN